MSKTEDQRMKEALDLATKFIGRPVIKASDHGGWPDVPTEEIEALYEVVRGLVDARFDRDCDGDSVIHFKVTDRKRFHAPWFADVLHHAETPEEIAENLRALAGNAEDASKQLSSALRNLQSSYMPGAAKDVLPQLAKKLASGRVGPTFEEFRARCLALEAQNRELQIKNKETNERNEALVKMNRELRAKAEKSAK